MIVLVGAALVCFHRLGEVPLLETDEGFAATRADSLLRHATVLVSYDDVDEETPQFRKPPLLYWCIAALLPLLGQNTWAVRLPTAVASFLLLLLLHRIVRRLLGEWEALWTVGLLCTVPFVLHHVRTAMLEMPLLFLLFLGVCAFGYGMRPRSAALAGAAGGAAVLLKGAAGLLGIAAMLAFGFSRRGVGRESVRRALLLAGVSSAIVLGYAIALPEAYRGQWVRSLLVGEGIGRVVGGYWMVDRLPKLTGPLRDHLAWHLVAALVSLPLLFWRALAEKRLREWVWLGIVVCLPFVLLGLKLPGGYPRYFLVVYPFALAQSAFFAREVFESRAAAFLLVPFVLLSYRLEPGPLHWIPIAGAGVALVVGRLPLGDGLGRLPSVLFLGAIAVASTLSPGGYRHFPGANELPQPDVARLAAKLSVIAAADRTVLVGDGFKCHSVLFYARKPLQSYRRFLLSELEPGAVRYGIFRQPGDLEDIPYVREEVVEATREWKLVKVEILPEARGATAILVPAPRRTSFRRIEYSLGLLEVEYRRFPRGFILTRVPDFPILRVTPEKASLEASSPDLAVSRGPGALAFVLRTGEHVEVSLAEAADVVGLDVVALAKNESLEGLLVAALDPGTAAWRELGRVRKRYDPKLDRRGGKIEITAEHALRMRFPAARTSRIRLSRTGPPLSIADVVVWVAGTSS